MDSPALEDAAAGAASVVQKHTGPYRCAVVCCSRTSRMEALKHPLHGSVFALVLTALAILVSILVRPFLGADAFLVFIAAIGASAWYGGMAAGVIASVCSSAVIAYFLLGSGLSQETRVSAWVRIVGFLALALLITWLTASWHENRRLFASTLASIGDAVVATDPEGRITFLNSVAETLTGWAASEARGKAVTEIMQLVDEKRREPVANPLVKAMRERVTVTLQEHPLLISRSGAEVPIEQSAAPVREDSGRTLGGILVFRDISKRRHLEEQVTQAQKMDAVGRLAGGIAGDFNNVLTVITGYAELLRSEISSAQPTRRFVDEIIYAGDRAAALTRHLLAFSKGPDVQPRVLDLNTVVAGMEPMLRRLLGQTIELILLPGSDLGRIKADPSQIEQVIINLATNARDAMPTGGKLVVETANADLEEPGSKNLGIAPGSYVMLAMSDTGVGMPPEIRSRLFEPFFTTKDPGKGSGLGLATVYGIVKQCEGQITVYSQPGCGTIFEMYLPRVREPVVEPERKLSPRGSETILLVDDEEGVRKLVTAVLRSNGYDVLEASNGGAALAVYDKNGHKIDMVLTDVVMPQMTGFELGRELSTRAPGLKILYMSGYRDNTIGGSPGGQPKPFLQKPFTPDVLLAKVREVLDAENA
ncbi:MAG: hybrid sensor histidine kinase/response regulator [Terriglobia bacterium]|nr:MAG: hybrid sensor histidine kinase/response regulator [Terriglobia bacterium]